MTVPKAILIASSVVVLYIRKVEGELLKSKVKYNGLTEILKTFQTERREFQCRMVVESFDKSGKTWMSS
jgi:hypothetical protein